MVEEGRQPVDTPTFVGRERELGQLSAAFDRAVAGRGSLAMVVGEPGIGKTALCEQLALHAAEKGGLRLVGHCYEEGSLSMPYLAFVESLRTYVLNREPEDLSDDLGPQAGDLARILPEIRDKARHRTQRSGRARGGPLPPSPGSLYVPAEYFGGPTSPGRAGRPARRRPGHPGPADLPITHRWRIGGAHRWHLPRRRGRQDPSVVRDAGRAAPRVILRAHRTSRPDRRRGAPDDERHVGPGMSHGASPRLSTVRQRETRSSSRRYCATCWRRGV